jgi:hypothetical protein
LLPLSMSASSCESVQCTVGHPKQKKKKKQNE